jgi:antimicrobial peptide system SdpA family protein
MRTIRCGLALLWAGLAGFVLLASPADSPLRAGYATRRGMIALFPQGWAFFTRDPREAVDWAYRPGPPLAPLLYPNASPRNLFGLSRGARALNVELAALLVDLPKSAWRPCDDRLERCLAQDAGETVAVLNRFAGRRICGALVVERQPPVPWAWGRGHDTVHMPSSVARLDVRCGAAG